MKKNNDTVFSALVIAMQLITVTLQIVMCAYVLIILTTTTFIFEAKVTLNIFLQTRLLRNPALCHFKGWANKNVHFDFWLLTMDEYYTLFIFLYCHVKAQCERRKKSGQTNPETLKKLRM